MFSQKMFYWFLLQYMHPKVLKTSLNIYKHLPVEEPCIDIHEPMVSHKKKLVLQCLRNTTSKRVLRVINFSILLYFFCLDNVRFCFAKVKFCLGNFAFPFLNIQCCSLLMGIFSCSGFVFCFADGF